MLDKYQEFKNDRSSNNLLGVRFHSTETTSGVSFKPKLELTYGVAGYGEDVIGVPTDKIGKVIGVATANVGKVIGV